MPPSVRLKLSTMMFLEFFIWGAWYVTLGTWLGSVGFSGEQIGLTYGTTALAAMISPFFVGMIADRFFATQRLLAILHALGGLAILFAATRTTFWPLYTAILVHTLCYMPTLALTNSLSFHQMRDPGREFPPCACSARLAGSSPVSSWEPWALKRPHGRCSSLQRAHLRLPPFVSCSRTRRRKKQGV